MKKTFLLAALLYFSGHAFAQQDSLEKSPYKFLTATQYQYYQSGTNPEMSYVAEVNNYPSPQNVLQQQKALGLSAQQKTQLTALLTEAKRKAAEMAKFIIAEETKLNALFENNKINEGSLVYYTNKIGALQGELRNSYLKTNYRTWKTLSVAQLKKYAALSKN